MLTVKPNLVSPFLFRRIPNSSETREHQCGTQGLDCATLRCFSAAHASEVESARVGTPEMVAPKDIRSPCQQIVALASTRLFESVDNDEQDGSELNAGKSVGVATSTSDEDKSDVQKSPGIGDGAVARTCDKQSCAHASGWSSPTDGLPHDDAVSCHGAQDPSPHSPRGAQAFSESLTGDKLAALEGLSIEERNAYQFDKKADSSSVGFGAGSLSDTNKSDGTAKQHCGAVEIYHTSKRPCATVFCQGGEDGGGKISSTMKKRGSRVQRELVNTIQASSTQRPERPARFETVGFGASTVSQAMVPTLGSLESLHGPLATSLTAAAGSVDLEEGVRGENNLRTVVSRTRGAYPPVQHAEVGPFQSQRSEHGASVDRSTKTIVENSESEQGSLGQSMDRPVPPGKLTPLYGGDAGGALVPKAAIVAPVASHIAAGRLRLPSTGASLGRQHGQSLESYGDDQQQNTACPMSNQGHGTSSNVNDGNGGLSLVKNHAIASHASPRGSCGATSLEHDEPRRLSRTRKGSSNPESEGRDSAGAGMKNAEFDAISSDDEHYNPSVSSQVSTSFDE